MTSPPRVQRYRRGRSSPSGFWLDSFDYDRLRHDLLDPLGTAGSRRYSTAVHDLDTLTVLDQWATRRGVHRPIPHPRTGKPTDFLFTDHWLR